MCERGRAAIAASRMRVVLSFSLSNLKIKNGCRAHRCHRFDEQKNRLAVGTPYAQFIWRYRTTNKTITHQIENIILSILIRCFSGKITRGICCICSLVGSRPVGPGASLSSIDDCAGMLAAWQALSLHFCCLTSEQFQCAVAAHTQYFKCNLEMDGERERESEGERGDDI